METEFNFKFDYKFKIKSMKQSFLLSLIFLFFATVSNAQPPPPPPGNYPFFDDFEAYDGVVNTPLLTGWTFQAEEFLVLNNHGSSSSKAFSTNAIDNGNEQSNQMVSIVSPEVSNLNNAAILSFEYRFVDALNYPEIGTQLPGDASLGIYISTDFGTNYTLINTINSSTHLSSNQFSYFSYSLSSYIDFPIRIKIELNRGSNCNYFLDIDNFRIGPGLVGINDLNNFNCFVGNGCINLKVFGENGKSIEKTQFILCDINGKTIMSRELRNSTESIPCTHLPTGIYLVQLVNSSKRISNKIFIGQ